jgi:hypothetical protein
VTRQEIERLERLEVDVLDPRGSHLKLRCRRCGATWRPRRAPGGEPEPLYWKCWRGCNAEAIGGSGDPVIG